MLTKMMKFIILCVFLQLINLNKVLYLKPVFMRIGRSPATLLCTRNGKTILCKTWSFFCSYQ